MTDKKKSEKLFKAMPHERAKKRPKPKDAENFVPLTSRDQMVKNLMKKFPSLTEEDITLMGG